MSFFLLANHFEQRIYVFPLNFICVFNGFSWAWDITWVDWLYLEDPALIRVGKMLTFSILEDEVNFKQPLSDLGISDKQKKREWELGGIEKNAVWKELKCLIGWGFASFPVLFGAYYKTRPNCRPDGVSGQKSIRDPSKLATRWEISSKNI